MNTDDTMRVPPHSIDSEQAVLGGLMLNHSALAKLSDWLQEQDFYRKDHQIIFRALKDLIERDKPADAVTLGEWFEENNLAELVGGSSYVIQLANNTPGAANITAYAEIVREKSQLRQLIDAGARLAEGAFKRGASSTDLAATSLHELSAMSSARLRGGLSPVKPAMKLLAAEMIERYQRGPGLLGLPTPWAELNNVTKGLRDGVLYVVGARPSMGKSVFGENLASFTALRGDRVALFSVEMTTQEVLARAVASRGDIPFTFVEQPTDAIEDSEIYWTRHTAITSALVNCPLLTDDTPSLKIEQLMARARREHRQKPLRLIVIDHLHDMATDPRQELRHEYGRITQGAKTLAKELGCPVVLLAQLSRNLAQRANKRPTLTDLRESGEIEQKADAVFFLHREDYYDSPEHKTHLQGVVELIPAKGRNIRIGKTVYLQNRFDRMRLDDWEGPLPAAPIEATRPGFAKRRAA